MTAFRFIISSVARVIAVPANVLRRSSTDQFSTSSTGRDARFGVYSGLMFPTSVSGGRGELCGQTS